MTGRGGLRKVALFDSVATRGRIGHYRPADVSPQTALFAVCRQDPSALSALG